MNRKILLVFSVFILISMSVSAQSRWYATSGGETILSAFSAANNNDGSIIRYSPVLNFQSMLNKDVNDNFGIFFGLALRNVGFIADDPNADSIRRKFRTYNLALPVGIKLGKLNSFFVYASFDIEYAFNYKEKTFLFGDKEDKRILWFTDRVEQFQYGPSFGIQFWRGTNIKFKYYLTDFFNPDRTDVYASEYERFQGNIFYISFNSDLFTKTF